jgi:hypothetical protein
MKRALLSSLASSLIWGSLLLGGCGPDARRVRAIDALETARRAVTELDSVTGLDSVPELDSVTEPDSVTEVDTGGGEVEASEADADVRAALADASARLEETERAYDLWGGATGSMAFERTAACLSVALGLLREALEARGAAVSADLETAEQAMASFTERPCRRRRAEDAE